MTDTQSPARTSRRVYFDVNVTNRRGNIESYKVMGRYVDGKLAHYGIVSRTAGGREKLQGENFTNVKTGIWEKAIHPAARTLPKEL